MDVIDPPRGTPTESSSGEAAYQQSGHRAHASWTASRFGSLICRALSSVLFSHVTPLCVQQRSRTVAHTSQTASACTRRCASHRFSTSYHLALFRHPHQSVTKFRPDHCEESSVQLTRWLRPRQRPEPLRQHKEPHVLEEVADNRCAGTHTLSTPNLPVRHATHRPSRIHSRRVDRPNQRTAVRRQHHRTLACPRASPASLIQTSKTYVMMSTLV